MNNPSQQLEKERKVVSTCVSILIFFLFCLFIFFGFENILIAFGIVMLILIILVIAFD